MFLLTPQAKIDLRETLEYIAKDNTDIAHKVRVKITETCKLLSRSPQLGVVVDHPTLKNIRYLTVIKYSNYILFYKIQNNNVEIIRFSNNARNWIALLQY